MRDGFENGVCVFCVLDRTLNTVLWEDSQMMLWLVKGSFLRAELTLHALIVPKRHVRFFADLTNLEVLSLRSATICLRDEHNYTGGMLHAREGDMSLNAGTVPHLHFNVFQPNCTGEVRIPVFKDPKNRLENRGRALEFAIRYEAGYRE